MNISTDMIDEAWWVWTWVPWVLGIQLDSPSSSHSIHTMVNLAEAINHHSINGNFRILKWRHLPYIRPIPLKYVLVWYSTSILGSWNSHWFNLVFENEWLSRNSWASYKSHSIPLNMDEFIDRRQKDEFMTINPEQWITHCHHPVAHPNHRPTMWGWCTNLYKP